MKIDQFQADFEDDDFKFTPLPNHSAISSGYTSNGFTYTPNKIQYNDTIFLIFCNHLLNPEELEKLKHDWKIYCPH